MDFEERALRILELKARRARDQEEIDLLMEEAEQHFRYSSENGSLVFQAPDGEWVVIKEKAYTRDEFDKEGLANEVLIAKDELKGPFDYSMLTKRGKITPDLISKHTHKRTEIKITITKRKTKPRKRK